MQRVPDAIEPIVAFRAWVYGERDDEAAVLRSFEGTEWRPNWNRAGCLPGASSEPDTHPAPHEGCSCGIHAMKDLDDAVELLRHTPSSLVGKVELAGKVIEHEYGYRAERARVIEIIPGPGQRTFADGIAARYGARVVPASDIDPALLRYWPPPATKESLKAFWAELARLRAAPLRAAPGSPPPFAVDPRRPLTGYRIWFCRPRDLPILDPMGLKGWPSNWHSQECLVPPIRRPDWPSRVHEPPGVGCLCGISAVKELISALVTDPAKGSVPEGHLLGKVELAGNVIESELDYRAERARVIEILPGPGQEAWAAQVAAEYGARVSPEYLDALPGVTTKAMAVIRAREEAMEETMDQARRRDRRIRRARRSFFPGD